MLKRLELVGFKSFADKTRFDFAAGITGVVGPNGSGKSNVVDAVRWILGEQSAKSLRGGEMADVIFNGSSSRKSLGLAEVTVAFDNSRRLLAVDADEVQLTRRVYRDGTGEYLINGQIARLKDFKEIFLGSGAGSGGYTIIAQGRVDELLQSSTKDRREIFDEAAGISRFKARKVETLRKLATVQANVIRSQDRLSGLEAQLRTLRAQAARAQKHQEYSGRLRELRIGLGTREYCELTAALAIEREQLLALQAELTGANRRTSELERSLREVERELTRTEDGLKHQERRLAEARLQIVGFDADLRSERKASASLEAKLLELGRQRAELGFRTRAVEVELLRATAETVAAEARLQEEQRAAGLASNTFAAAAERIKSIEMEMTSNNSRQMEIVREAASARSKETSSKEQVERLQKGYSRRRNDIEQFSARRRSLAEALDGLSQTGADIQARLQSSNERFGQLRAERDALAGRGAHLQTTLETLRVRHGELSGRVDVLENLEQSHDGLAAGVRYVLQKLKDEQKSDTGNQSDTSLLGRSLHGLVADLLTVPRDMASFVELALGESAQRFVVRSEVEVETVVHLLGEVPGRVGFIPSRNSASQDAGEDQSLARHVECELPGLPAQLLGNVYLVESLIEGRRFQQVNPRARIATRRGEMLEPDGTLTVGHLMVEAGIVSRKSELRELRKNLRALSESVSAAEIEQAVLNRQMEVADGVIESTKSEVEMLSGDARGLQEKIASQRQQVERLDENVELLRAENIQQEKEVQLAEAAWLAAKLQAEEAERASEELRITLIELQRQKGIAEEACNSAQQANLAAQVSLKGASTDSEQARKRLRDLENELSKRRTDAIDLDIIERDAKAKLAESTLSMLRSSAGQAEAYREKEHRERLVIELESKAAANRRERDRLDEELKQLREGWKDKQEQAHHREMAVHELDSRRKGILDRIQEDYGVDLTSFVAGENRETEPQPSSEAEAATPGPSLHEIHTEIEELRRKLTRLGSVNMEALEELQRVESEFTTLQAQHADLDLARKSLQDVIDAINNDSRKLFIETLTAIRGYFQELFRKLFGGGQADIILEDQADVLESGIEITARPPGKELRSLSLLSGGEKTLTAVALLLAIFRNRPSPFCILDEVDAALDEANTARLAGVLREFLDQSQFIVVTHKKRTMAAADRLWGVTMLESGVSRLLPMRFEDWPEEVDSESAA